MVTTYKILRCLLWTSLLGLMVSHAYSSPSHCSPIVKNTGHNKVDPDGKVLIKANKITYDDISKQYHASGNVDIFYENKQINADNVYYNSVQNTAKANGHVIIHDVLNDVIVTADEILLNNSLTVGLGKKLYAMKGKYLKISSKEIIRKNDHITEFYNTSFTPCDFSKEKEPLWEIRAKKVTDNQITQDVTYEGASFNILGLEVFDLPDFTYPRPNVERRTGLLIPEVNIDNNQGVGVTVPYFWEIAPNQVFEVAPTIFSNHFPLLQTQYQYRTNNGNYQIQTALTKSNTIDSKGNKQTDRFRGSILSSGRTAIDADAGWGFDVNRVSDDTFFTRFNLPQPNYLQSRVFYNFDNGRTNFYAGSYSFQTLDQNVDDETVPFILPYFDFSHLSNVKPFGGNLRFSSNLYNTYRTDGIDTRRLITQTSWEKDYALPAGFMFNFTNELRADIYHTSGGADPTNPQFNIDKGTTFRFLPQTAAKISLPLLKKTQDSVQLLEPTAQLIFAPYNNNSSNIPNEDGSVTQLDIEGLFDLQRFYSHDLIEDGPRANIGFRYLYHIPQFGGFETQFGQSFRLREENRFASYSGLGKKSSDYIGRFVFNYKDNLHLTHRYRIDSNSYNMNMSDISIEAGTKDIKLGVSYFTLDNYDNSNFFNNAEQFNIGTRVSLSDHWHFLTGYRQNIPDRKTLETRGALIYTDECFQSEIAIGREHIRDRDIEPRSYITFKVRLLALGDNAFL